MSLSPYQITLSKDSNNYYFSTESGLAYTVYADRRSNIFPLEEIDRNAIYIGFTCVPAKALFEREYDPRVGLTVMAIVASLIRENPKFIITYVCSPKDGQARQRSIAFSRWYNESPLEKTVKLKKRIFESHAYCGVLYRKNHPNIDDIEIALQDFNPGDKFNPVIVSEPIELIDGEDLLEEE